jgi:hypothetical protein
MALPRHLSVSEYYVVFAKLTDSEIACETKTRLWIRKEVTKMLCSLYRQDIDTYSDIPEDLTFFAENEIEKLLPHFSNDGLDSLLIHEAEKPADRPGQVFPRVKQIVVRTSAAFLGASPDAPGEGLPTFRVSDIPGDGPPTFRVTRSSECMNHRSREYDLAAFPDLHNNGLGTVYDSKRLVKVGAKEARRHLLSLALRTFAQHPIWSLVNIDNTNKDIGQGLMSVSLERDSSLSTAGCHLNQTEVQDLLRYQHSVRQADFAGAAIPVMPASLHSARRVLNSIKHVEASIHGSATEREDMRRQQYGFCQQIGLAHCMLTLTPSDIGNGIAAIIGSGNNANPFQSKFFYGILVKFLYGKKGKL